MDNPNGLATVKKIFKALLPVGDKRAKIQAIEFISALVFTFAGDSKQFSLEGFRRKIMGHLGEIIPSSTFWDRLSRESLTKNLQNILGTLMGTLQLSCLSGGSKLLDTLGVNSIQLIDSSSISLWDGLKKKCPGTRTTAGVKWHACFDLLTGMLTWFDLSATSGSDRNFFPNVEDLKGALIIFDLGYFDYALMKMIDDAKGFFLSRVKSNSNIMILLPVIGIGKNYIEKMIDDIRPGVSTVDFIGLVFCKGYGPKEMRIVGFWNPKEKNYHWYITNLSARANFIYPLYRLRWQIELIFKSCKATFNLNELPTNNPIIVMNLILSSIISYISSLTIVEVAKDKLEEKEIEAITYQRIAKVSSHLSREFIQYFVTNSKKNLTILYDKIILYARELFYPGFRARSTSLQKGMALC